MAGIPKFEPFHCVNVTPKGVKSPDCDHYQINPEGSQDASACLISGHCHHVFSGKFPETYWNGQTDGGADMAKTATGRRMNQRTLVHEEIGYFGYRADGRANGRTIRNHNASGAWRRRHNYGCNHPTIPCCRSNMQVKEASQLSWRHGIHEHLILGNNTPNWPSFIIWLLY